MNIAGNFASEENDGALEILGITQATGGDSRKNLLAADRIVAQGLGVVGGNVARRDGIHIDALARPPVRKSFGNIEVSVYLTATVVGMARHGIPDAAYFELGEAHDELATLDTSLVDVLENGALVGLAARGEFDTVGIGLGGFGRRVSGVVGVNEADLAGDEKVAQEKGRAEFVGI